MSSLWRESGLRTTISGTITVNISGTSSVVLLNSAGNTASVIDIDTNTIKVISDDHAFIHQGIFFAATITANLTSAGSYDISIITSAKETHFRPAKVSCSADKLLIELYENNSVQISSGATYGAITSYNHDRNASLVSVSSIVTSATITSSGTRISAAYIGGGTGVGGARTGSELGPENEWILKSNYNYNIKLTNGSASNNIALVKLTWYEY